MRIIYNIASQKRIDKKKVIWFVLVSFILSVLFIVLGINKITIYQHKYQDELIRLREFKNSFSGLQAKSKDYQIFISQENSRWTRRISFLNQIISYKSISYVKKFNVLEDNLPTGTYVSKLIFNPVDPQLIELTLMSDNYENLLKALDQLMKFQLKIFNQSNSASGFSAIIQIKINNEKN